jgi:hypothetical protein
MTARRRAVAELVLAAAAAAGCVLSWVRSRSTVEVAPIAHGEPSTTSVAYYAPLLVLALSLATAAGVLLVLGVARLRRGDDEEAPATPEHTAPEHTAPEHTARAETAPAGTAPTNAGHADTEPT